MGLLTIQYKGKQAGPLGVTPHKGTVHSGHSQGVHMCPFTNCFPTLTLSQTLPHTAAPMTFECILVIADLLTGRGRQR